MTDPLARRGFLRDLVGLPLVGGGLTLIGAPSAVARPVTPGMLATYSAWLEYERKALMHPEAVLFVDDREAEIAEGDILRHERMRADDDVECA